MTDAAWVEGMRQLAYLPDATGDPQIKAARAALYREHLDDLSDSAWLHAARVAIRSDRWFPTVAALREYAEGVAPTREAWDPVAGRAAVEQALATVVRQPGEDVRVFLERVGAAAAGCGEELHFAGNLQEKTGRGDAR